MKKIVLLAAALLLTPLLATAADLANGERINRNCALCHGAFAQGAKGRLSPRLAGLPREYLIKAMEDYRSGVRRNPTMMETTGLANMSNNDIEDIAAYLNMLDLTRDARFDVRPISMGSDLAVGETIFMDECKDCHGRDGRGKPNKEAPPLTGQHGEYIFSTIKLFQAKLRNHDNDPEDETFKAYSDQQILNTVAFISTLDDKLVVPGDMFRPPMLPPMRPRMTNVMQANA
ncbi:MAG: c-type cytochrome [Gammaproteobacteria bacterium]|nr:c-type cytochrome [Gammaproteobacteria bacterium]